MAGPSPRDEYNPTPSVNPTQGAPNDMLSVRANPTSFGSQVGEAGEKFGATVEQTGTQAIDVAAQYQGVLNEAAANQADLQLATKGGQVYTAYKQKEGFDAVNSKDQAIQDYTAVHQQIRSQLNPAAARSYDQLANRRLSYTIADMNDYAAQQTKVGVKSGIQAQKQLSIDQASKIAVAGNDQQFDYELGSLKYDIANELTNSAAGGPLAGIPAKTNPDGSLSFDQATQQGKTAQAVYDNELAQETGKIWGTRIQTLANDTTGKYNVLDAVKVLNDNQGRMPAATYAEWSQKLINPLRSEQARSGVEQLLGDANKEYIQNGGSGASPPSPNSIGNVKNASGIGFAQPVTPNDGVILATNNLRGKLYDNLTLAQIGAKWEGTSPENVQKWVQTVSKFSGIDPDAVPNRSDPNVLNKLMKGVMLAEKSSGDQKLFSDDVINTGVSSALAGQKANLGSQTKPGTYQTPVDYLSLHEPELLQQSRDLAARQGFDVTVQDQYAQRMETRINEMRSAQTGEVRAMTDSIVGLATDPKAPFTNMTMLDNSQDPQVRNTWLQLQALNPYARQTVQNIVLAQAQGKSRTYGTAFYPHLQSVLSGEVTDPVTLSDYIGGDKSPISSSGFTTLQKEAQNVQTPQGQAFAKDEAAFFEKMNDETTGATVFPGINNPAGNARMNTFLETALPQIEAGRAQGKTSADLFDEKSPDYVGKSLKIPGYQALFTETQGSLQNQAGLVNTVTGSTPAPDVTSFKSLDDLSKAVKDRPKDAVFRTQATEYAIRHKWISPNVQVPRPQ